MSSINGTPAAGPLAGSHMSTLHHELDQVYLQSATGADGMDRWIFSSIAMGSGFAGGGVAKDFSLSLPGALSTGDLTIRLYSPYDMAHETTVSLNGSSIGSATWSGITWTEAAFAGVSLLDGANTVSLFCEGALDKTAVDWFEVVYERAFEAASDTLRFTHAGGYRYRIADFTTNDVELYDITDAAGVQRVLNGTYSGSGPYTLEVEPAGATGTKSYLAVASAALKTPGRHRQGPRLEPRRRRKRGGLDHDHPPQPGLGRLRRSAGLGEQFGVVAPEPGASHRGGGHRGRLR